MAGDLRRLHIAYADTAFTVDIDCDGVGNDAVELRPRIPRHTDSTFTATNDIVLGRTESHVVDIFRRDKNVNARPSGMDNELIALLSQMHGVHCVSLAFDSNLVRCGGLHKVKIRRPIEYELRNPGNRRRSNVTRVLH